MWVREKRDPIPGTRADFSGPVLLRFLLWPRRVPFTDFQPYEEDPYGTYPVKVLYGGPISDGKWLAEPMGKVWLEGMRAWLASHNLAAHSQIVPIAPEGWGIKWPHTEWRWWYATEYRPHPQYRLVGVGSGKPARWVMV